MESERSLTGNPEADRVVLQYVGEPPIGQNHLTEETRVLYGIPTAYDRTSVRNSYTSIHQPKGVLRLSIERADLVRRLVASGYVVSLIFTDVPNDTNYWSVLLNEREWREYVRIYGPFEPTSCEHLREVAVSSKARDALDAIKGFAWYCYTHPTLGEGYVWFSDSEISPDSKIVMKYGFELSSSGKDVRMMIPIEIPLTR